MTDIKIMALDPRKLRPKPIDMFPETRQVVALLKKYPGLTSSEIALAFGWKRRRRLIAFMTKEGFIRGKKVLMRHRRATRGWATIYYAV